MKKALIIFLVCVLISCSFSSETHIHWTEKNIEESFVYDSISMIYKTNDNFDKKKIIVTPLLRESFIVNPPDTLEVDVVKSVVVQEKYIYQLLCTQFTGENDNPVLVTLFGIYEGKSLIDCIIVDQKYTFEIKCFSKFCISEDEITINQYEVDGVLVDEGGIIGYKNPPDTLINRLVFRIENGKLYR